MAGLHFGEEFGSAPKFPIGAAGGPQVKDFTLQENRPVAQTQDLVAQLRSIQKASPNSDSQGKFNLFNGSF